MKSAPEGIASVLRAVHEDLARPQDLASLAQQSGYSPIGGYVGTDLLSLPVFGITFPMVMTKAFVISLAVKSAAAFGGAALGACGDVATVRGGNDGNA